MIKFSKFCFKSLHRDTDRRCFFAKFVKIVRRVNGGIMRCLGDKKTNKISAPSQTVATARIAPNACHGQPQRSAHNVPNFIHIGSLSAEL